MAASITISNTFATQAGPIPLSQLDTNYSQLVTAFNTLGNFFNYYADSSGSANALVVTVSSPQLVSYAAGLTLFVKVANTNTGASTINVNALGAKSITTPAIGALSAGDLIAGAVVQLTYDGTQFQLGSVGSFIALRATTLAVSGATTLSSNVTATATSGIALTATGPAAGTSFRATDGTRTFDILHAASNVYIGTQTNDALNLYTNGTTKVTVSTAGNVTIAAPSSGNALSATGTILSSNGTISAGLSYGTYALVGAFSNHAVGFVNNSTVNMLLDTSGNLGIGTTPVGSNRKLEVGLLSAAANYVRLNASASGSALFESYTSGTAVAFFGVNATASAIGGIAAGTFGIGSPDNYVLTFGNTNNERARIDTSGRLYVGATTFAKATRAAFRGDSTTVSTVEIQNESATGTMLAFCTNGETTVGSITFTSSGISVVTTSDQRLKTNITDADSASDLIDAIQVRKFDWISDGSHQRYGMVAQELLEVAPEAVNNPADPTEMMGVDYSKLVPLLVKEVQSLRSRIHALELT